MSKRRFMITFRLAHLRRRVMVWLGGTKTVHHWRDAWRSLLDIDIGLRVETMERDFSLRLILFGFGVLLTVWGERPRTVGKQLRASELGSAFRLICPVGLLSLESRWIGSDG